MKNIPLNKFEDLKRNRLIKKLRSNAIAIKTNQIEIHLGCNKMEYLKNRIDDINVLDEIDLNIFIKFNNAVRFYPIGEDRNEYNKEYLKKLDLELKTIDNQYLEKIFKQCDEIINQFQNINSV